MARIGILALQGAFIEHERMLREMGAECIEIRNKKQLAEPISGSSSPAEKAPSRENSSSKKDFFSR